MAAQTIAATCAPPDPATRAPTRPVPPGAIDSHAHVFGPVARFPYNATRSYTPPEAPLSAYLAMLDALGVHRGVLVQPSVYGMDNACLLDGLRHAPDRLRGVIVADPRRLDAPTIDDWTALGVRGVRFNMAVPGSLPLDELESIGACLAEIGWHLDIMVDTADRMVDVAPRLAKLRATVVVEQMGRMKADQPVHLPGFQALLDLLRLGKDYAKLSHAYHISTGGHPYQDTAQFAHALVEAAPGRLVWGSDWPHPIVHGPMPNDGDLLDLLARWVPSDEVRKRVLVDNAARLYGFSLGDIIGS